MVGQGVLRECLAAPDVSEVLVVGRTPLAADHPRLRQLIVADLFDVAAYQDSLAGFDACFFCLGVSSTGMSEQAYTRITYDLGVAIASALVRLNPALTLTYVSGTGTDSTETGKVMWARVKGRLENALLGMGFAAAFMLRPGFIAPLDGIRSKTRAYRVLYAILAPVTPLLRRLFPGQILTTREMGQAMLQLARHGYAKNVLEARDIRAVLTG